MKKAASFAYNALSNEIKKQISYRSDLLLSKPMQVTILPTQRCNVKCLMCHCWKETRDYITKDDILRFIDDLVEWQSNKFILHIGGGEPLIFKGIFEILEKCRDNDVLCKVTTNGYGLTEKVCDDLIASGLPYLTVSLDSHIPEIHDEFRGRDGTFKRAVRGIRYLSENSDMTLGTSSIIMKNNVSEIEEFVAFLLDLEVDRLLFQPIRDYYNPIEEWMSYPYWIKDHTVLDSAMDYLIEMRGENSKILNPPEDFEIMRNYFKNPYSIINNQACYIGYERMFVDDKGDITLCDAYEPIGNIRDNEVKSQWHSVKAAAERQKMTGCDLPCTSNCKKDLNLKSKVKKFAQLYRAGLFG